ncbi:aspartate--tRNA(Asn) ligase [Candidatus Falkowbacteria bacterium CG10_big_fil_rev_8_21_14_0_10_43_10]|uniref:Aspartate--tRNA(Asp/Asn) ligase n=1 Tax=Candidatus Falkowbacteria bacterium CG10_big_fil_rev_8_21_14_0_10_43_10 TaxID=1974567 RepID=A0A2H0V395_9BACT|nr:MAG: aspartate--tRNA(Asn) ligase [Candidatus Falkowbacteria bacterium CG10_big_fil_rev_8_21_14_0_10_43_10]
MELVTPKAHTRQTASELKKQVGTEVQVTGAVYRVRELSSNFCFIIIRTDRELIQCKLEGSEHRIDPRQYAEGNYITATGRCVEEKKSPHGFEISIQKIEVLSKPAAEMPFSINQRELNIGLDINLDARPISLRHPGQRAIFKIQAAIAELFGEALSDIGFTKIHTPKIVFAGAEGGANVFCLDYFGRKVFLAQSPQFYKQMMVGVFGRVYESGPVFRAEPHETARHLNEYTSMDFEMGPISSFTDIMEVETYCLRHILNRLPEICLTELELLKVTLPYIIEIPAIRFSDAIEIITKKHTITDRDDLDATSEQVLCKHVKQEIGSDFVFVTHYPTTKRPVYAMEDPNNPEVTLSFDLLYNGLEITTGGQRIHDYSMQVEKMKRRGLNPEDFESYLQIHKYGMPPHGGLGLGLERLTKQLLGLQSIKEACLFPRTMNRVTP